MLALAQPQARARRNAKVALAQLIMRRQEREEVNDFLAHRLARRNRA